MTSSSTVQLEVSHQSFSPSQVATSSRDLEWKYYETQKFIAQEKLPASLIQQPVWHHHDWWRSTAEQLLSIHSLLN